MQMERIRGRKSTSRSIIRRVNSKHKSNSVVLGCYIIPSGYKVQIQFGYKVEAQTLKAIYNLLQDAWYGLRGWHGRRWNRYYEQTRDIPPIPTKTRTTLNLNIRGLYVKQDLIRMHDTLFVKLLEDGHIQHSKFHASRLGELPEYMEIPTHNIIKKFGLELEGGWNRRPVGLRRDGSVHMDNNYVGEVSTTPSSLRPTYPWDREFFSRYPKSVNSSCGMHIHVSFRSIGMYGAFLDNRFPGWLLGGLKLWGRVHAAKSSRLMNRLNGQNPYCRLGVIGYISSQMSGDGERYTAVNYSAWYKYKTIEIRVLPMFNTPRVGQKAVLETLRLVNLWGSQMGPLNPRKPVPLFGQIQNTKERGK